MEQRMREWRSKRIGKGRGRAGNQTKHGNRRDSQDQASVYKACSGEHRDKGMDPQAEIALYKILSLKDAENTEDVINVIDEIYNHVLDPSFEKRNGNLEKILNLPDMALANDAWQECMTDEQMEDIIQKIFFTNHQKKMMSLDIKKQKEKKTLFLSGK